MHRPAWWWKPRQPRPSKWPRPSSCLSSSKSRSMRQRSFAVATSSSSVEASGKVESQYLVGSLSPSGRSARSHSSARGSLSRKSSCAGRTRTAAKREASDPAAGAALAPLQLPTSSTSRRGGYSCGFDLRLDPIRLDHVGALKRLSTEEHDLEDSQQTINSTGKDVGNCKVSGTATR